MSDLVGNPEDRFSRVAAHNILLLMSLSYLLDDCRLTLIKLKSHL